MSAVQGAVHDRHARVRSRCRVITSAVFFSALGRPVSFRVAHFFIYIYALHRPRICISDLAPPPPPAPPGGGARRFARTSDQLGLGLKTAILTVHIVIL